MLVTVHREIHDTRRLEIGSYWDMVEFKGSSSGGSTAKLGFVTDSQGLLFDSPSFVLGLLIQNTKAPALLPCIWPPDTRQLFHDP